MNQFKEGDNKVLIATDVSSRGIDIPNVGLW
jgi:ATP-dependent RNA helicase RhlE